MGRPRCCRQARAAALPQTKSLQRQTQGVLSWIWSQHQQQLRHLRECTGMCSSIATSEIAPKKLPRSALLGVVPAPLTIRSYTSICSGIDSHQIARRRSAGGALLAMEPNSSVSRLCTGMFKLLRPTAEDLIPCPKKCSAQLAPSSLRHRVRLHRPQILWKQRIAARKANVQKCSKCGRRIATSHWFQHEGPCEAATQHSKAALGLKRGPGRSSKSPVLKQAAGKKRKAAGSGEAKARGKRKKKDPATPPPKKRQLAQMAGQGSRTGLPQHRLGRWFEHSRCRTSRPGIPTASVASPSSVDLDQQLVRIPDVVWLQNRINYFLALPLRWFQGTMRTVSRKNLCRRKTGL